MLRFLNIFELIVDFISEKCEQLVDYVLNLLGSFTSIIQGIIIIVAGILIVIGALTFIKKSIGLIISVVAIAMVAFILWTIL